jgi:outer membrane protein assembly factor BamB
MQLAVIPILVGPLQTLLALLPGILLAVGTLLATLATPRGMKRVARFLWHQKLFTLLVLGFLIFWFSPGTPRLWGKLSAQIWRQPERKAIGVGMERGEWPMFRGGPQRFGSVLRQSSEVTAGAESPVAAADWHAWDPSEPESVFSSPAIAGDQVIYATAAGIGPFTPTGRGAIVSVELETGRTRWRYAPDDYRATFSSPVVADGLVVCGEGLHQVRDARVTCLDLAGNLVWQFPTQSHVEATPAIAEGRVYVAAGDDGLYCLSLRTVADGRPQIMWHLAGDEYRDCESSPLVVDGVVYFGLGEGGQAVCAVDALSGTLRWRRETSHPVFAPVSWAVAADGKQQLIVGLGRGNFVQSAEDLWQAKLQELQAAQATADEIERKRSELAPGGEVWSLDPATGEVVWKLRLPETVLGAIAVAEDGFYVGCRDGALYQVAYGGPRAGEIMRRWDAREPIVSSPAVTERRLLITTLTGRVHCLNRATLEPSWSVATGSGGSSFSSPTIVSDRLIVGTADQGLVGLSLSARERPPVWNRGLLAGMADQTIPTAATGMDWAVDPEIDGEEPREVWPVALWPDRAIAALSIPLANEAIVTAWSTVPTEQLLDQRTGELRSRCLWQQVVTGHLVAPPMIADGTVVVALNDTPQPEPAIVLTGWDARDGREKWQVATAAEEFMAITVDEQFVYLWADQALSAWTLREGRLVWQRQLKRVDEPLATTAALATIDGLLLVLLNAELHTLDGTTGKPLRGAVKLPLEAAIPTHLTADHQQLFIVQPSGSASPVQSLDLVEGVLTSADRTDEPLLSPVILRDRQGRPLRDWHLPTLEEGDEPATAVSSLAGRLFFLTRSGRLVCLANGAP